MKIRGDSVMLYQYLHYSRAITPNVQQLVEHYAHIKGNGFTTKVDDVSNLLHARSCEEHFEDNANYLLGYN
ncbi:hypothetical protein ACFSJY_12675 [Thalassotalea euphylliae]|uniref:hypothetical protein n=1 Tax=Thalassotalea euphylliae TaxID=1655234 RepID=UPI003626115C